MNKSLSSFSVEEDGTVLPPFLFARGRRLGMSLWSNEGNSPSPSALDIVDRDERVEGEHEQEVFINLMEWGGCSFKNRTDRCKVKLKEWGS